MIAALIVAALLLLPGPVLAQPSVGPSGGAPPTTAPPTAPLPATPEQPSGVAPIIDPRTPPPPTIPSSPPIVLPAPAPPSDRPRKLFDFRPIVGVSEEWTDNFARSATAARSNFRSALSPGVIVGLDDPTLTGQLTYNPLVFHDSSVDEYGVHHTLAGHLSWAATPHVKLTAAAGFTQSDDPARADTLNLQRGREEFTTTTASLAVDYVLPLVTTKGSYRLSRFDRAEQSTTSHTIGAGAILTVGRIHTLSGGYEYLSSETRAETRSGATSSATGDSTVHGHQLTGTFSRELSETVAAGVTGAYAWRNQTRLTGDSDFSRWSFSVFNNYVLPQKIVLQGNIGIAQLSSSSRDSQLLTTSTSNLSYWLGPATLRLGIERGFSETFGDGQDSGVVKTSGISGSISYQFTPLLSATAGANYRENDSTGEGGTTTTVTHEKTTGVSAQATYQILRWLTSTLDYSYTKTTSSEPERGFVENRVRAALNAVFD